MKVIIFGLGSIGKRHAQILGGFNCDLFAYRSNTKSAVNDLGIKEIYTWNQVESLKADIAFITNPTYLHISTAIRCAKLGMHLFIEKPLSNTLDDIDTLESICRKKELTCYIAYCLRFHPVIKEINKLIDGKEIYHVRVICSSYLPTWRKGIDSKQTYSALRKQGGGVLLDLSHQFDYIQYLFGKINRIEGSFGRLSEVTIDAEDFADILMKTNKGIYVNLHLNFLSFLNEHSITVDCKEECFVADLIEGQIEIRGVSKTETKNICIDRNAYFREQTQYFFDNLGSSSIMNNLGEAKNLLAKILELKNGKK